MKTDEALMLMQLLLEHAPSLIVALRAGLDKGKNEMEAVRDALKAAREVDSGPMLSDFDRAYMEEVDTRKVKKPEGL